MADWESTEHGSTPIRPGTLAKLNAVAVVREMDPLDVLDEAVEAARARLSPKPKTPSTGGRGKGRKADQ